MNSIPKTTTHRLMQIASSALVASVIALGIFGSLTQCTRRNPTAFLEAKKKAQCKAWSDDLEKNPERKTKLRRAFVTAIIRAAQTPAQGDVDTRKQLLGTSDNARDEILRLFRLDPKPPFFDPAFPKDAVFYFFEPEVDPPTPPEKSSREAWNTSWFPNEHCLHYFYLPKVPTQLSATTEDEEILLFATYLRCCYQPW